MSARAPPLRGDPMTITPDMKNGRSRIAAAFAQAQENQTAALMPYYTLGFPDRAASLAVVEAIAPYSDPSNWASPSAIRWPTGPPSSTAPKSPWKMGPSPPIVWRWCTNCANTG
ncbi:MAG: hypothetical protein M5U34_03275 [Chloroflexi bacterium]|nr:hypothetical protein [Chloroflexota bacterium]